MAGPRLVATVILLVLFWDTYQADAEALDVTIAVTHTDPPDFTPENDNDFRTSSGPHTFTCTATGGGAITYQWTSSSPTFSTSGSEIARQSVHLIDEGTHTCTATRGSDTGTATITVNIVGAGIFVFVGDGGSGVTGVQPNNGLVISSNPESSFRFRFFCRSDNTTTGIGELLGLDGNPITDSNFFGFPDSTIVGEFRIENVVVSQTVLPASEQGVYTCQIPLQSGVLREVNIGVYPNGFNDVPTITSPLVFTPGPSPPTLTYTSSTSIATAVTCTRSNSDGTTTTVGPLYDGNPKEFGGVTYELTQTVTNRGASTFDNVLTINQPLADIVGSSFSCVVSNSIGSSTASNTPLIMGAQITDPGTLTVGEMATIQCNTSLTNIRIEWLLNDEVVDVNTAGATELDLVLNPVNQNFNGRVYTCRVTVAGGDTISDMFTVMTQLPDVTVDITTSGSAVVGMSTTLTCTVSGADNLAATISFAFTGPNTDSGTGTSLQLLLGPLDLSDAGRYTCTATISSGLLENNLVPTDMVDVNLQIPAPSVTVRNDVVGTIYSGSIVTLTCRILLTGIPDGLLNDVSVNGEWIGAGGNLLSNSDTIAVNPFMGSVDLYESTVVFNTISSGNAGTYTCQVEVTHPLQFITDVMTSEDLMVSIADPTVTAVVALTTGTIRFPNVAPYNTFSLTCTAMAPNSVVEPKAFIWRRAITAGDSCNQGVISDSIVNSNENQTVSTSVLTVTETVAGSYSYCCRADLTRPGVTGTQSNLQPITVTGPADPVLPTNLMNDSTTDISTIIRWTVPNIAFTPETYVVNYGVSPGPLNFMSDPVQNESDVLFVTDNLMFSVELTGLNDSTMYDYQVVATNTVGSTPSVMRNFSTTIIFPGPPLLFMITVEGPNSLSFSWDAPAPIEGVNSITNYIVRCTPQLEGIPTPAAVNQSVSEPLSARIDDLASGVLYRCSVAAMNNVGEGMPAEDTATTEETAPNGVPQNFTITPGDDGPTSRGLTFFWNPPLPIDRNGMIISYTITCTPNTVMPSTVSIPPGVAGHTVEGFIPFTQYICSIVATNSVNSGPADSMTITTNQDAPDGPPLTQDPGFSTTADNPQRVIFTLQPPGVSNGEVTMYSIRCTPSDSSLEPVTETIASTSEAVEGFNPAADYMCFFSASTSGGDGPNTTVGLPVTTLPVPPMITSVMNQSSSEVRVDWVPDQPNINGHGAITQYTVYVNNTGMNTNGVVSSYVISGLEPFQVVMVEVSASTPTGEGARSEQITGMSSEAPPGPVSNIQWVPLSASSVNVSWSPPQRPNGIILGYSVVLERYEDGLVINSIDVDNSVFTVPFTDGAALEAEVPYNVTVTARNSAGVGEPEEIVNFTVESDSPPAPSGVMTVRSDDGTQMTVSWTPSTVVQARSLIQVYRVTYSSSGSGSRKRQSGTPCSQSPCDVPGTDSNVLITGLEPGISYAVRVAIVNGGGRQGSNSGAVTAVGVSSSSSFPAGAVGGAVGGVAVVVIVVLIILAVCYVRHKKQSKYTPYSSNYGMDTKPDNTKSQPLAETATKSFMQSEEDLATFEPSKTPVAGSITDSQAIERLRAIPVAGFTSHVQDMHQDRDKYFELEYQSISNEPLASYDIAKLPYNKAKNRFANIFPYDFCRVKLQEIEGVEGSDYVNASYVDGYNHPNAYVAAQGPLPNTVTDFWRMVWERRLNTIVMLTKTVEAGKRKCEQYWPENVNENFEAPNSTIMATLTSVMPFADYEIKTFLVKDNAHPDVPPLEVMHYHFLGWPDHGVPKFATSLIAFIRRVRKEHNKDGPPMLVHCSAGVGRTGTYILLDSMLERMKAEETVNVYEYLRNMRAKRVFMVQTLAQYTFIHDALNELITCGDTSIAASNLRVKINRLHKVLPGKAIPGFEDQFQLLDHVSRKPVGGDCSDALQPYNKAKNRYLDRLPYNLSRARLRPTGATGAEYINASFVDGYKQRNTYIAVQAPLQETVSDFWRMIWEFKSKAIVMLCSAEENGQETSYPYWSMRVGEPQIFGKLQITLASEEPTKDFAIRKFEVKEDKVGQGGPPGFMVTQFHVTQWPEQGRPPSSSIVLGLIDQLIKVQRGTGNRSITVMCNDGMGRTGTFIAIHAQLERVKSEGVVDFFQFIKSSRIHRPFLVSGLEHYIFCHDALADYLDSFDTYANFKDFGSK